MGTKVSEDLRKKKNKGTPVSRDLITNPETWSEYLSDEDRFYRSPLKKAAAGLAGFFSDQSDLYGRTNEQEMRDQSWGGMYSPREALYDLTGGYDLGGQISDYAAVPLNAGAELLKFTGAALQGVPRFYQGFGDASGYLLDSAAEGLLGTPEMYEDNPLRDTYADVEPYFQTALKEDLDGLMTTEAEREIDAQVDAYVDYDTMMYENPDLTMDQFNKVKKRVKDNIIYNKYSPQLADIAARNYRAESLDKYGIYNPGLLAGTNMEEDEGQLMRDADFGAFDPLMEYISDYGGDKVFDYSSKEAQEKLSTPEIIAEFGLGFGLPGAARSALSYGTKKGLPSIIERGVKEALPGTVGRGVLSKSRFKNPFLRYLDSSREYGSQYFAPIIASEILEE